MIANGLLREALLSPSLEELGAHQASTAIGVVLIGIVTWLALPWVGATSRPLQVQLGLTWLALTVAFEFGFGHWVAGHPWSALFHDYNLAAGRVWILVLGAVAAAPWVVGRLRWRSAA